MTNTKKSATGEHHPAPRRGDRVEVVITDAGEGDRCIGRLSGGMVLMVRGPAAPGDRARVEITGRRKRFLQARLVELIEPSPHRTDPVCPHFGVCGGCKWQHLDYPEQRRLKRKMISDALERLGGFADPPVEEVLPADRLYTYRNKLEFSFADRRFILPGEPEDAPDGFALGFHAPGVWWKVLSIDSCSLAPPVMNRLLEHTRTFCLRSGLPPYAPRAHEGFWRALMIRCAEHTNELMINLVTSHYEERVMRELDAFLRAEVPGALTTFVNNVTSRPNTSSMGEREHVVSGPGFITERLGGFTYRISANSFFQTNTRQAERLFETAIELAQLDSGMSAYDLFCGTGALTLMVARRCARVLGLEGMAASVDDARDNAARNAVENAAFEVFDMNRFGRDPGPLEPFGRPEVVFTDPPRAGMHPRAVPFLQELAPRRLVYISCKPASLARDAAMLCADGRYRLARVRPVDLFPQTQHIESVALFEKM